jgi:hypothetical protein
LTLIEVLISMFVLLIGLLGVGTICQLGRLTLTETAKYDRAAACGRAGLREVRIRRMLDATNWYDYNGTNWVPLWTGNYNAALAVSPSLDPMDSYCIDPVLMLQVYSISTASTLNNNLSTIDRFPSFLATTGQANPPPVRTMKRVTLGITTISGNTMPMPAAAASRIFTWRDDLAFDTTYVPKLRPQRIYRNINGTAQAGFESSVVAPFLPGPRTTPVYGETDLSAQGGNGMGGYSWMVTVTPAFQEMALLSGANAGPPLSWSDRHLYSVSVVVFYKRDLSVPVKQNLNFSADQSESSERSVAVTFRNPTGYGGGDVILTAPSNTAATGDFFNIKRDDWLLLCGQANVYHSADPKTANTTISQPVNLFRWYRIVAIDDSTLSTVNSPRTRNVTLAGPDWPIGYMNSTVYTGVLMNNIVGVYSDVVTLENNRLWAPAP